MNWEIEYSTIGDFGEVVMGLSPKGDTYNEEEEGLPLLNGPTEFGSSHPIPSLFTTDSKRESKVGDLIFFMEFYLDDKIFIFTKKPSASFRVTSTSDTGRSYGTREMILGRREFRKLIIKTMKVKGLCKLFLFAFNLLITAAEKFYFTARKTLKSLK